MSDVLLSANGRAVRATSDGPSWIARWEVPEAGEADLRGLSTTPAGAMADLLRSASMVVAATALDPDTITKGPA